ncbi:MAG: transketolase [Alphaproteobacteria bacterium]|nr:transketolase [Alphaproteobacteria bacterium]
MTQTAPDQSHIRNLANAVRFLALDAVQEAKSGHPGLPLGMADVATVLFSHFLKFNPAEPHWPDRDRFVLSAGHGSMLLYALLYLTGYPEMTLDQLQHFRKVGSRTPGHPEYGHAPGIETTTGPLGQGLGNAVGMAMAERHLNARFGPKLVDHKTYVIASDGDLEEGISHEAIGLAGHYRLKNLIVLWDDNSITIDGSTTLSRTVNMDARFRASGWVTDNCNGHDAADIFRALSAAQKADRPVMIACRTVIGFGMPGREGTQKAHSDAPGEEVVAGTRKQLGWTYPPFVIPDDLMNQWRAIGTRGANVFADWSARKAASGREKEFDDAIGAMLPVSLAEGLVALKQKIVAEKTEGATRKLSEKALEVINAATPLTIGGSADLTPSNNTLTKNISVITPEDFSGRYLHYGIREHGMAAAMNGMALHGGIIPYGGTFMVFSDYCRPSIRLAALMGAHTIFVMTHDSIGVGEDGPTHQPIEHLAALRAIPNLLVMRPADGVEVAECWQIAMESKSHPSLIALSRQDTILVRDSHTADNLCARGGYVLREAPGAKLTLLATGTEVGLALTARDALRKEGIEARLVSLPCWALFNRQPAEYQQTVLGPGTARLAIEAAGPLGWERYLGGSFSGSGGAFLGMHGFGASGPAKDVYAHFGITVEKAVEMAKGLLK